MEYDMNRIRKLCEKYYDAETSAQEEKILREYFTHAEDIPDSLKSTKVMICGLVQASEAEYTPEGRNARGRLVRRIAWSSVSIAASIAICLSNTFLSRMYPASGNFTSSFVNHTSVSSGVWILTPWIS